MENTISTARALAASIECVEGVSLDVGKRGDWATVDGTDSVHFILTLKRGEGVVRTRIFASRKEQCDWLRDQQ
jgi:hypothetical protein